MQPKFHTMKPGSNQVNRRDYTIQALQRGLQVLDAVLESRDPLTLEEISERTGLPKSTAFRVVVNLLQRQYLIQIEEGYWLGLKLLRFGALVEERLDLVQQARPFLIQMRDQVRETVHLGVLDDDLRVVYLEKLPAQRAIGLMISRIGSTAPMHCTALGKALAAFLPEHKIHQWIQNGGLKALTDATITDVDTFLRSLREIRSQYYSVDNGEFEDSVRCVAAPIRDRSGSVIAAISISGPHTRMPAPLIGSSMATQVVETAQSISSALGYVPSTESLKRKSTGSTERSQKLMKE